MKRGRETWGGTKARKDHDRGLDWTHPNHRYIITPNHILVPTFLYFVEDEIFRSVRIISPLYFLGL